MFEEVSEIELFKLLSRTVDSTFNLRGFNPDRHAKALVDALDKAGWKVVKDAKQTGV